MGQRGALAAAGLILALGLLPLIVTPVLPLIDFYNHVARFQVLATLADNPLLPPIMPRLGRSCPILGWM